MNVTSCSTLCLSAIPTRLSLEHDRRITLVKCFTSSSIFPFPWHSNSRLLVEALYRKRSIPWRCVRLACGSRRVHSWRAFVTPALFPVTRSVSREKRRVSGHWLYTLHVYTCKMDLKAIVEIRYARLHIKKWMAIIKLNKAAWLDV